MDAVKGAGVDIALRVKPHAIWETGIDDSEFALVRDRFAISRDIERINRVRFVVVVGARRLNRSAVDDVEDFFIR